ncbi:MAG: hypothetical protein EOO10_15365 [Chitinophagaceae bacterium]|nr:MAG: hypothetical protein EOO10_15365 [Chitinophagaceae bacterium]
MKTILYLTDLYYQANGRAYYEEDLYVTSKLKPHFNLLIGHPQQALSNLACADLIVFRNTGPVMRYKQYFNRFVEEVNRSKILTYNSFDGKADMRGKGYLLQLTSEGFPVIPTIDCLEDLALLGPTGQYIVKLKDGADSIGMKKIGKEDLVQQKLSNQLVQPFIDFVYEVSFYYLDGVFQYALYAPETKKRWDLKYYEASTTDLAFADQFINWSKMARGIVRVDACRLNDGSLLLVELEDLNPFLSLDALGEEKRENFIGQFIAALNKAMLNGVAAEE